MEIVKMEDGSDTLFCPHFKADAPDGFDIVFPVDFPQFPAQIADMHFQGAVCAVRRILADTVQEQGLGYDLGGGALRWHIRSGLGGLPCRIR